MRGAIERELIFQSGEGKGSDKLSCSWSFYGTVVAGEAQTPLEVSVSCLPASGIEESCRYVADMAVCPPE